MPFLKLSYQVCYCDRIFNKFSVDPYNYYSSLVRFIIGVKALITSLTVWAIFTVRVCLLVNNINNWCHGLLWFEIWLGLENRGLTAKRTGNTLTWLNYCLTLLWTKVLSNRHFDGNQCFLLTRKKLITWAIIQNIL